VAAIAGSRNISASVTDELESLISISKGIVVVQQKEVRWEELVLADPPVKLWRPHLH
jgi:hypothetical protein